MRVLGIVAEYDPFHRGHERHFQMARSIVRPDFTWVVLSGCWKQRGEMALFSPYDRARCALEAGADAVFLMPAAWTVRDAGHYAYGAVSLLDALGATHLAFGAETDDLQRMREAACMMEMEPELFRLELQRGLKMGWGYPKALAEAAGKLQPGIQAMMNSPNNLLGLCYLRALTKIGSKMEPVLIPRTGQYFSEFIDPAAPSAAAVRRAIRSGNYREAFSAVPEYSKRTIEKALICSQVPEEGKLDLLMVYRIRSLPKETLRSLPDVSEGLEARILEAAKTCQTRKQLMESVSTRRYPKARISRICAWAMLGKNGMDLERLPPPEESVLLGMKKNAEMTGLWKQSCIRILSSMKEAENRELWQADLMGWNLWNLCAGLPANSFYRQKMLIR